DLVAVKSITQGLNFPKNMMSILEGESLLNDAAGVVAFKVAVLGKVYTTVGNTFVTDIIDVEKYDYILTCGPTPMMEKLVKMVEGT
ncbi:hypothetical protein ACTPEF_24530, partial [Clostridioides difficile]